LCCRSCKESREKLGSNQRWRKTSKA
jgi:hypothetical protein